jgi:hypothetical protein
VEPEEEKICYRIERAGADRRSQHIEATVKICYRIERRLSTFSGTTSIDGSPEDLL